MAIFVVISLIFFILYFKLKKEKEPSKIDTSIDPYKASYEVEGFHNDFEKVGSGYPIKKNQKLGCCTTVVDVDASCQNKSCRKKD